MPRHHKRTATASMCANAFERLAIAGSDRCILFAAAMRPDQASRVHAMISVDHAEHFAACFRDTHPNADVSEFERLAFLASI